ncbi:hypothetical protein ACDY97_23185 [Rhizobium mongolense]|uniref:hypothetical protein n=1 Tax=Rhizobium mongolense TaxID=57676 RepID=UPI003555FB56
MLFAPVFLLAIKVCEPFFPQHLDRIRSFGSQAEFQLLNALLLSAFLISDYEALGIIALICALWRHDHIDCRMEPCILLEIAGGRGN